MRSKFVHYVMNFCFFDAFDPPSPSLFRNVFLVTLTSASNSSLNFLKNQFFFFFWKIHQINLGRTCFDRVGRKSETNNIFFRPQLPSINYLGSWLFCGYKKEIWPSAVGIHGSTKYVRYVSCSTIVAPRHRT